MEDQPRLPKKRGRELKPEDEPKTSKDTTAVAPEPKNWSSMLSHGGYVDPGYRKWSSQAPFLYHWLDNRILASPSFSCRWGPRLMQDTYRNEQCLYLSEKTDGCLPNTLVIANYSIVKFSNAAAEHVGRASCSAVLRKDKTIIHPGEVHRIRELPQNSNIVATHSYSPYVFIWDVKSQPSKNVVFGATVSQPDLILAGYQKNAISALAMCPTEPYVLSGGTDKLVVLWSIQDHVTSLAMNQAVEKSGGSGGSIIKSTVGKINDEAASGSSEIGPLGAYSGHEDTVKDVAFCPFSVQEFCSVGGDSRLILWDRRVGTSPVHKVEKVHDAYLYCVDWNPHDSNLILTGSADNSILMFDRRKLVCDGTCFPVHKFVGHKAAVHCVQWSPDRSSVFGSSAADGLLNIWDYEKVNKDKGGSPYTPPGLLFQHVGHRICGDTVVDFHWNMHDPWTLVSSSPNTSWIGGGGILQIWRLNNLITQSEEEHLAAFKKFKLPVLERSKGFTVANARVH